MDSIYILKLLLETLVTKSLPNEKLPYIYVDNRSELNLTDETLTSAEQTLATLNYFLLNITGLIQPCNDRAIEKI